MKKLVEELLKIREREEVDKINFENGEIVIEDVDYHRGMIALPSGTIYLDDEKVRKVAKRLRDLLKNISIKTEKNLGNLWDLLDYLNVGKSAGFSSSYTEFLYPGSPDYGFHLSIDYIEEVSEEDIENYFLDCGFSEDEIVSKDIDMIYNEVEKVIDELNEMFSTAEEPIYDWIKEIEKGENGDV